MAHSFQSVEVQRKRPLAIRTTMNPKVPFICQPLAQFTFDVFPSSQPPVVHPHQTTVAERMAVVIAEGTFGGGANVGEDEGRGGFGGDALEVDAVPGWDDRGEDAWFGAEFGVGIVSYSKAVAWNVG